MTTELEGGEGSASLRGRSLPRERPGTYCRGGWVDLSAGLNRCAKSLPTGIFLNIIYSIILATCFGLKGHHQVANKNEIIYVHRLYGTQVFKPQSLYCDVGAYGMRRTALGIQFVQLCLWVKIKVKC